MKPNTTVHHYRCGYCEAQWPTYELKKPPVMCIACHNFKAERVASCVTTSSGDLRKFIQHGDVFYYEKPEQEDLQKLNELIRNWNEPN